MAIQKVKDGKWVDETGKVIPIQYVTPLARLKEKAAGSLIKDALKLNKDLSLYKKAIVKYCDDIYDKAKKELNVNNLTKGNFTFFNFDRSVKIERSVSDRITFDDITIQACKDKLDEFFDKTITSEKDFLKEIVTDAFSTKKGHLDTKKVMDLMKWRTKVNDPLFQECLNLLADAIRKPDSKIYYKVWLRQPDGGYKLIDLNFSSL